MTRQQSDNLLLFKKRMGIKRLSPGKVLRTEANEEIDGLRLAYYWALEVHAYFDPQFILICLGLDKDDQDTATENESPGHLFQYVSGLQPLSDYFKTRMLTDQKDPVLNEFCVEPAPRQEHVFDGTCLSYYSRGRDFQFNYSCLHPSTNTWEELLKKGVGIASAIDGSGAIILTANL